MADDMTDDRFERSPEGAFPVPDEDLSRLADRLAAEADDAALLEVAYDLVDSPIGTLLLASTGAGLVRVAFEAEGFDRVLEELAATVGPRILRTPLRSEAAAAQLGEYFAGRRTRFDLALDHRLSSGFRAEVQRFLPSIAHGRTLTYKEVAAAVGNPGAVRAVGSACATNPHPIVVPCHRVLRSDGGLGGYLGGTDAKRILLELETAA